MKHLSFKLKTVLAIALVEAIALIILITSTTRIMSDTNDDQIDRYVSTATRIFSATVKDALIAYDLATLNTYANELTSNPDMIAAKIVSASGQTLASAGSLEAFSDLVQNPSSQIVTGNTKHLRFSERSVEEAGTTFGSVAVVLDVSKSIEGIQKAKDQAILIAAIEIVVAALVSIFLGTYLTRQLKILNKQTQKIMKGDFSSRVPVASQDELGKVSDSFNQMAESLEIQRRLRTEYSNQLKALNTELEQRVERRTEALKTANMQLTQTNKDLQDTREELIQKEKFASLGRFAGGAAHEINNPLSVIAGNLEILNEYLDVYNELAGHVENLVDQGALTSETLEKLKQLTSDEDLTFLKQDSPKLIEQMTNGSKRIGLIIDDLMQFKSRHNGTRTELEVGSTAINIVSEFAKEYPNRIEFDDQTKTLAHCELNKNQFASAIHSILQNAIEFSPANTPITVQLISDENRFTLRVIDQGEGIPAESLDKVREPFYTTKPVGQGTGMGLTICESIIEGFGGSLAIESTEGQGTIVTISLPIETTASLSTHTAEPGI